MSSNEHLPASELTEHQTEAMLQRADPEKALATEHLRATDEPLSVRAAVLFGFANFGIFLALLTPIANVLPRQINAVAPPSDKVTDLGIVTALGAATAMIVNVLVGYLSDRTRSRFGPRRPWIASGLLIGVASLLALTRCHTLLQITLGWVACQLGINGALAAVSAYIPDQVPWHRRGVVSGISGAGLTFGVAVGLFVVAFVSSSTKVATIFLATLYAVAILPFLFFVRYDTTGISETFNRYSGRSTASHLLSDYRDYFWAWLTRFTAALANTMATLYLYFYLTDVIRYKKASQGQFILVTLSGLMTLVLCFVAGRHSDRLGKRKAFVIAALTVMAAGELVLAILPSWPGTLIAAALLGTGYGTYLAVDQALITQVLPSGLEIARDMGILNIANVAPQIIAPAMAAPLIEILGYRWLYATISIITLVGAFAVIPIRKVE